MAKAFRPYKGEWVVKEHTLVATVGDDVETGDLIMVTSGGVTVDLGTSSATAIIGISIEDLASTTTTQTIRVLEPLNPMAEMIGPVTSGAIATGRTDSGRACDLNDHEGAASDTDTEHHLTIVRGTVASTDGSSTAGEAVFRIAQTLDKVNSL